MPHTPRHIGTVEERLRRFRERNRREGELPPVSAPAPEIASAPAPAGDDFNIQDFLVERNAFRTRGQIPVDLQPRPPSTAGVDRLGRIITDLGTPADPNSILGLIPGGRAIETGLDLLQLGETPARYPGSLAAQGRTPFRTEFGFNEAERFFQTLPQDEQIALEAIFDPLNFAFPVVGGGGAAIRGGIKGLRARNLGNVPELARLPAVPTNLPPSAQAGIAGQAPQPLPLAPTNLPPSPQAGIFGQVTSTSASSPESRLLALRESKAAPQELSSLEQSVVNERILALRESRRLEQTALPAPSEVVPPPQIETGQVARLDEIVPEGVVDAIPSVQREVAAGPGEDTLAKFQRFLNDRARLDELDVATTARTAERARRFGSMENRVNELVEAGVPTEDAINLATRELSGPLPGRGEAIEEFSAPELREALFREVFDQLKGEGAELRSTATALDNALAGIPIPRRGGTEGGSAFTRLQRVFGEDLTEALAQPGSLEDIIRRDVQDRNLGLTGFQGARRGDPGPVGDVLNLPQPETPRMALGEELPPFSGIESLAEGEDARRTFLAAGRPRATGPAQVIDAPGTQGALNPPELPLIPEPPAQPFSGRPIEAEALFPAELIQNPQLDSAIPPFAERAVAQTIEESRLDVAAWRALQPSGAGSQLPPVNRPPGTPNLGDLPPDDLQAIQQLTLLTDGDKSKMLEWAKLAGVNVVDLGNLLRANLASIDMSYLRQQKKMIVSHPIAFTQSFKDALRALWSQEYADNLMRQIFSETDMPLGVFNPVGQARLYDELNLQFLRPDWNVAPAGRREESLIILGEKGSKSRPFAWMAQHSPWINISGRAFVAGTNSMNWRIWKGNLRMLQRIQDGIQSGQIVPRKGIIGQLPGNVPEGHSLEQSALSFGHMLEEMTGRARLGPLEKLSPALNAGFFSIRQRLGLLLSPRHLFNPDKFVRQEAWRNFMSAIATGSATVLAGERMGLWDVETDPRSSDYMKIKLFGGRVRIDIWGGNQQYFVLYARLLSALATGNEAAFKSTKTGKVEGLDPVQTLTQFARVGASPGVTTGIAAGFEKDFGGRTIDRTDWRFWLRQNLPLSIQDIREAYEAEGLLEAAVVTPFAVFGEGVQAHELSLQDVALQMEFNIGGQVVTGIDYDDLPERQRERVRTRLKTLRSPKEREEFERKIEETKTRSKAREVERRRNFFQQGRDTVPTPQPASTPQQQVPQQDFGTVEDRLRRLRESKVPVGAGR